MTVEKIEYCGDKECADYNGFTNLPKFDVITKERMAYFIHTVTTYSPTFISHHQILGNDTRKLLEFGAKSYSTSITVFYFNVPLEGDIAYGILKDLPNECIFFRKCRHDFDVKTVGNCLNEYTCRICGHKSTVDSSG